MRARDGAHPWWERSRRSGRRSRCAVPAMHLRRSKPVSFVSFPGRRERSGLDGLIEVSDRVQNTPGSIGERPHKPRLEVGVQAEEIVEHQNLPVTSRAGPDADGGNAQRFGDLAGEPGWNA